MKLLHIADLHIGKRVNGISMIEDQRDILGKIVSLSREERIDALLIAGDIYDKASPSAEAVAVFDAFLARLADAGVHVLAVPGNHDSAERIAYAQSLLSSRGVCFPPVFDGRVETVELADEHGPVVFWLLPFLKPGDVRRHFPDDDIGDDYSAAIRSVLGTCDPDPSLRNVMLSHQLVTFAGTSPERADEEIKLGGIDNVDVSVYDGFDYVALGHVHRPQRVGRDTVRYAGSPLKYSFSEARYAKSAVVLELGPKREGDAVGACVGHRLVPLPPLHDMREVRMSLRELLAGEAASGDGAEDYLHITLTDEHPQLGAMARIREVYPNVMALDYDAAVFAAHGLRPARAVDPDKMDMVELFATFYEEQVGRPIDGLQRDIVARIAREVQEGCSRGEGDDGGIRQ